MIRVCGKSDVGRVREINQDVFSINMLGEDSALAVVCDGMGGGNGGSIASSGATKIINKEILGNYSQEVDNTQLLLNAVIKANEYIYEMSQNNLDLRGMGTTATAVITQGNDMYIAHVGDSRVYRLRENILDLITTDHSVVQALVERGELTPEEARTHPHKNYITRAVGVSQEVEVDVQKSDILNGDIVLICSDGLSNYFKNEELGMLLKKMREENLSVDFLINEANSKGGADNITAVIIIK